MTFSLPSTPLSRRSLMRLAGLAGLGGAAGSLAACAGAPGSDADDNAFTVYWNAGHAYQAYDKVIEEFEKEHGVTVNLQKFQWPDLRTRLLSDFQSGSVPDLVESSGGWVREFAVSKDALSLQSRVDADGAEMGFPDDWQPQSLELNTFEDETYGIQLHLTCTLLFYNKTMLADANVDVPTTWDELLDAAKKLTSGDVHGIALNQDHSYSWPWMLQNGVAYYDAETKDFLTPHDAALEALQFQQDLVHKHKVSPTPTPGTDYSGPQKLLSANRAAMILTGPWDLAPIAESSPDLDVGIAPVLRGKEQATLQAGAGMFIPAKAKDPDMSWDFVKRITALEVELAATEEADMLMPRLSWAEEPEVQDNELFKPFADSFEYAVAHEADLALTGKSGDVGELYKTLYQGVVINADPPEEALQTFLDAAGKLVKD
ncbi:MAG: ABC transporter substrate-binding protein [Stackebrandtia sp.]